MGAAYEAMGRSLEAARAYDRFLDAAPPGSEGRPAAEAALADILRKLGTLRITATLDLAGLEVDGAPVDGHPDRVRVAPGSHTVSARAKDGRTATVTSTVVASETASVLVSFVTPDAPAPPGRPPTHGSTDTHQEHSGRVLPWVLGGVGVAGLLASGAFYLVRRNAVSDLEEQCLDVVCPGAQQGTIDRANLFGTLSLAALGVGATGIGSSIVLLSTGPGEEREPSARIAVRVTGQGTMAVASGRF